jgi:hypothetical protein
MVTFYDTVAGKTTVLATVAVVNGVASYTTTALSKNAHSITATYSGDTSYYGVTSKPLTITAGRLV